MGEPFDLYCTASAEPFREGAVVALDGIEGFFDQYFEAARPGAAGTLFAMVDTNTIVVNGPPPGQHKILIELADSEHNVITGQMLTCTVPGPAK